LINKVIIIKLVSRDQFEISVGTVSRKLAVKKIDIVFLHESNGRSEDNKVFRFIAKFIRRRFGGG